MGSGSSGRGLGASGASSSTAAGIGPQAPGPGTGPGGRPLSRSLAGAVSQAQPGGAREVTGTLIGTASGHRRELAFGAPGLHSAGAGSNDELVAIGIGGAALILALGGAQWERRREEVIL